MLCFPALKITSDVLVDNVPSKDRKNTKEDKNQVRCCKDTEQ